ncbi:MAG TPA: hypothetical protein VK723_00615 [Thermoplasmata archaeon]|nr:hypothetical protein [Thermoplasmata archaeon]
MGFRSTSVKQDQTWEDTKTYVPPVIYAFLGDRNAIGSIRKMLEKAENE